MILPAELMTPAMPMPKLTECTHKYENMASSEVWNTDSELEEAVSIPILMMKVEFGSQNDQETPH